MVSGQNEDGQDCQMILQKSGHSIFWLKQVEGENRLDVGEGKDVNLEEHCPRWKLHKQCIKYLGPKERETYEVIVEDSKLMYKLSRQIIDTTKSHKGIKWIFVLSTCKNLYIGQDYRNRRAHSSTPASLQGELHQLQGD